MLALVRAVVRALAVAPPVVGALYVLALAAWAGGRAALTTAIVAAAIATGLVLGLVTDALLRLRAASARRPGPPIAGSPRGAVRFVRDAATRLLVVAALHGALTLWSMADAPQLYATSWYARGGLPRLVQIVATDVLGPRGVLAAALVAALIFVRPLSRLGRRSLRLARGLGVGASAVVAAWASVHALAPPGEARAADGHDPGTRVTAPADAARGPGAKGDRPNVLLLGIDSLRADRLEPRIAPHLSALADRGTRFERAYVSIPRALPSWVTVLTGRDPHHHGIRSELPSWEERARDLDALPQRLATAGYTTAAVSDFEGDVFRRIELGFGHVDAPSLGLRELVQGRLLERETPLLPVLHSRLGRSVLPAMRGLDVAADPRLLAGDVTAALRALRGAERPFLLAVSFSTAHAPHAAPAPFYAKYTDASYRGRFKYHAPVGSPADEATLDADDIRQLRALYDGAVSAVDAAVGRLLAALEGEGLANRTVIVLTADHGEALLEDGRGRGHGDHLFGDEGTHVPLVIVDPRLGPGAGRRREPSVVRDVDVAPTLYALTDVPPPEDLDGRSLAPALRGEPLEPSFAFAETGLWLSDAVPGVAPELRIPYPGIASLTELDTRHEPALVVRPDLVALTRMARHRMVRDERMKLVYVPTRRGVRHFLYDTVADPGETQELAASRPDEVQRLEAELLRWMLEDPAMEARGSFVLPREPAPGGRGAPGGLP